MYYTVIRCWHIELSDTVDLFPDAYFTGNLQAAAVLFCRGIHILLKDNKIALRIGL